MVSSMIAAIAEKVSRRPQVWQYYSRLSADLTLVPRPYFQNQTVYIFFHSSSRLLLCFLVIVSIFCGKFVAKGVVLLHFAHKTCQIQWFLGTSGVSHLEIGVHTHCILVFLLSLRSLRLLPSWPSLESGFHVIAEIEPSLSDRCPCCDRCRRWRVVSI